MAYTHPQSQPQVQSQVQPQPQTEARAKPKTAMGGFIPSLSLFLLAPIVGEFVLGNLPITWWWALLTLAPLYGGGAILIREITRRLGLGWPSMVVFGLVYAVIEEAFVTQSLFNPDYVGLRLLDYGYMSSLGISIWWTVFVLGIHTVWSTAVPIAIVESFTPERRRTPWLGFWGLAVVAILFVLGCVATFTFQMASAPFMASTTQFVVSGVVIVLLIIAAILLGSVHVAAPSNGREAPQALTVGGAAFVLGSAFMSLAIVHDRIPALLNVAGMLGLLVIGSLLIWNWSRHAGWSDLHRLAAAGGFLLVYVWYAFIQVPSVGGVSPVTDTIGNAVIGICAIILLVIAWRRVSARTPQSA